MGLSGILLNVLLVAYYGETVLGTFNLTYAVYIVVSQLAVFGIQSSVLKHTSEWVGDHAQLSAVLSSALWLTAIIAALTCGVVYLAAPTVGRILGSPSVMEGLLCSVAGLWCFSMNKILLAFINGRHFMRAFAILNLCRYASLPAFLILLFVMNVPPAQLPMVLSLTEGCLLIVLLCFSLRFFSPGLPVLVWVRKHLVFGGKAMIGGGVVELNTRVDVLVLGLFTNERTVGTYSFAAMLAEGLDQIPGIFRVNLNPLITRMSVAGRRQELAAMIRDFIHKWTWPAWGVGVLAVAAFPALTWLLRNNLDWWHAWVVFSILTAGVVWRSGYAVFWELPVQSGHPGWQTALFAAVALTNVALNVALVPLWGMLGAALATSCSFLLSIFYLKSVVRKLLCITL